MRVNEFFASNNLIQNPEEVTEWALSTPKQRQACPASFSTENSFSTMSIVGKSKATPKISSFSTRELSIENAVLAAKNMKLSFPDNSCESNVLEEFISELEYVIRSKSDTFTCNIIEVVNGESVPVGLLAVRKLPNTSLPAEVSVLITEPKASCDEYKPIMLDLAVKQSEAWGKGGALILQDLHYSDNNDYSANAEENKNSRKQYYYNLGFNQVEDEDSGTYSLYFGQPIDNKTKETEKQAPPIYLNAVLYAKEGVPLGSSNISGSGRADFKFPGKDLKSFRKETERGIENLVTLFREENKMLTEDEVQQQLESRLQRLEDIIVRNRVGNCTEKTLLAMKYSEARIK